MNDQPKTTITLPFSPEDLRQRRMLECHGLDTPERVCFYEPEFYVLSNFSAFRLIWRDTDFDTSEAAYHYEKFCFDNKSLHETRLPIRSAIRRARSAHEAFKIAEARRDQRRLDWDYIKVEIMLDIIRAKAGQHEYVQRKLLQTGDRILVENSWRDAYWGSGPSGNGQNVLGKLWMQVRAELRNQNQEASA